MAGMSASDVVAPEAELAREQLAQISIRVPANDTARVQEACLHPGHAICEMVEAALFARPS
jgi:D-sedoheptulose 7-phosphate isomerase